MRSIFRDRLLLAIVIGVYVCASKANGTKFADPKRTEQSPARQPAATPAVRGTTAQTQTSEESVTNSVGMKRGLIPAGEFMMGSKESAEEIAKAYKSKASFWFEGEHPRHLVRITKPFYLVCITLRWDNSVGS